MVNKSDIKLILFDIGNVLVNYDSHKLCANLATYCCNYYGIDSIYEYLFDFGIFRRLELGQLNIDTFYRDFTTRFKMHWDICDFVIAWTNALSANDDMKRIVSMLANHFDIGILSNIDSIRYRYIVRNNMIDMSKFSHILLSYKISLVKPDIRLADYISGRTDTDKSRILFIDDKDVNVRSMQAGGIRSIQYENPSKLLDDFREIGIEL